MARRRFQTRFVKKGKACPVGFPEKVTTAKMKRKTPHVDLCATREMAAKMRRRRG